MAAAKKKTQKRKATKKAGAKKTTRRKSSGSTKKQSAIARLKRMSLKRALGRGSSSSIESALNACFAAGCTDEEIRRAQDSANAAARRVPEAAARSKKRRAS